MSVAEGIFYLILLLLTPLALVSLMVWGVVKLTEADKRRFQRMQAIQQISRESACRQPKPSEILLEAYFSKGMTIWGLFVAATLTYFGFKALFLDPVVALVLGWWTALFGVIFIFIFLKQFTTTEPVLTLTTTHIEYAKWPFRRIPWHDIRRCHSRTIVGKGVIATYLCLELADQSKYLRQMGWLSRKINRLNWLIGCSAIHVALTPLKVDSAEVVKRIQQQIRPRSMDTI